MPYTKDNPPQWASKKSAKVQEVAIRVFNENIKAGKSESEARIPSLIGGIILIHSTVMV